MLKVNFKLHKKLVFWFIFCVVLGVIAGIITVATNDITLDDINNSFIDQNIVNSARANTSVASFIWYRVLSAFVPLLLLFVLSVISNWTALAVFPFMVLQGYWTTISVWWAVQKYALGSVFLLGFYIIWMFVVMAVLVAGIIWVMKICTGIRRVGFRAGMNIRELLIGIGILLGVEIFLALFEYLVYWVFLGRIVYPSNYRI
jgi:hypothetical protein